MNKLRFRLLPRDGMEMRRAMLARPGKPKSMLHQRKGALLSKRLLDLVIAIPATLLLSPILLLIALVICSDFDGGPFYNQVRVGLQGRRFTLFKFRTMYKERSGIVLGKEVRDGDERVTRVGRYLRRYKLDELPQLVNVIRGDMSIVGPRPDIPIQVEGYTEFQRQRLLVRPGLTGVAQVSGNTWLPWSDRIVLDVWYIQNWSLWLDVRVIWRTFLLLFHGERPDDDPFGLRKMLLTSASLDEREIEFVEGM